MADIAHVTTSHSGGVINARGNSTQWRSLWETLDATNPNGTSIEVTALTDGGMFQAIGTFDGAVTLQGSLNNTDWFTLVDIGGAAVSLTAAGGILVARLAPYVRVATAGGGSQDVDAMLTTNEFSG